MAWAYPTEPIIQDSPTIQLFRSYYVDYVGFDKMPILTNDKSKSKSSFAQQIAQAYQTFMKDSAQLFGSPSPEAHKFAVDIFNFEKRIAEITPGHDYLADPLKINNKMKVCCLLLSEAG